MRPSHLQQAYRLTNAEARLLLRLYRSRGRFVRSRTLYKFVRNRRDVVLDGFDAHVRVVVHSLRRKLAGSDFRIEGLNHSGYRCVL